MGPAVMGKDGAPVRGRGRPRTEGLDDRVLEATRRVVAARGYGDATLDQIAAEAGASKGSIYRRWPSKGVLVYDACIAAGDELAEVIDTGRIRDDLLAVARLTAAAFRDPARRELFEQVVGDAAHDDRLAEHLRTRFFLPRSEAIVRRVERAVARDELARHVDPALVPAVLNGSQQYVWAVRRRALTDDEVRGLVDMVLGGS